MTRRLLAAMVVAALAGGVALADGSDVKQKAEALVKQLSSDDADVREKATEELSKLGPDAIPVLEEASKSSDPEVAWRAEKALGAARKAEAPKEGDEDKGQTRPQPPVQRRGLSSTFSMMIGGPGSFSMTQDSTGKVTVSVTEKDKDGKDVQKSYSAPSMDEFKQKYPEVAKKYHLGENALGNLPQMLNPPDLQDLDKQMQDILKDLGKGLGPDLGNEFLKRWRERLKRGQAQPPAPQEDDEEAEAPQPAKPPEDHAKSSADFGAEVAFIDEALRDQLDLEGDAGVVVESVAKDSPAEKSGLEAHDVVLSVNGEPVKTKWDFRRLLLEGAMGGKVELDIVRKGEKKSLSVDPKLLGK